LSIARLNSFANFTCSEWIKDGVTIGDEEGLRGRSNLILKEIHKTITKNYSLDELKNKTIIDIGCYDGFYLTNLSYLNFKEIVGLEPKKKNILKGIEIRKFLKIPENNLKFICGNISDLSINKKFDIVLCLGVLHHVTDHFSFLKKLVSITNEILFIDTRVVQDNLINKNLFTKKTEMLDVIYKFKKPKISFSVHKYESSFNDTSTYETGIVSIPNKGSIEIFLEALNFKTTELVSQIDYRKLLNHKRDLDGLLLYSVPAKKKNNYSIIYAIKYERQLFKTLFRNGLIEDIYKFQKKKIDFFTLFKKNFYIFLFAKNKRLHILFDFFFSKEFNYKQIEILKNLHYSIDDKIKYEFAKENFYKKEFNYSYDLLSEIINKLNSDFRSVYRSYYLLYKICKKINDIKNANIFADYYLRLFLGKNLDK
jgi:hypothetical protein